MKLSRQISDNFHHPLISPLYLSCLCFEFAWPIAPPRPLGFFSPTSFGVAQQAGWRLVPNSARLVTYYRSHVRMQKKFSLSITRLGSEVVGEDPVAVPEFLGNILCIGICAREALPHSSQVSPSWSKWARCNITELPGPACGCPDFELSVQRARSHGDKVSIASVRPGRRGVTTFEGLGAPTVDGHGGHIGGVVVNSSASHQRSAAAKFLCNHLDLVLQDSVGHLCHRPCWGGQRPTG
jgi:hypothetical protein